MSPLFRIIKAIIDGGLTDATEVARRLSLQSKPLSGENRLEVYQRSLKRLALTVLFFPIPILVVGLVGKMGWLVATIGIFWSVVTVIFLMVAAPFGIILEAIIGGGIKDSGTRYIRLGAGILVAELSFTLFRAVVPVSNNPAAVPIVGVAAAILGLLGASGASFFPIRAIIGAGATATLLFFSSSFFFPESFRAAGIVREKMDEEISEALKSLATEKIGDYPLCADAQNQEFAPESGITTIKVGMRPECWSGWISTPIDWKKYYMQDQANKGMEILFRDGYRIWLPPNSSQWFNRRGIFRVRGEGTLFVSIEK